MKYKNAGEWDTEPNRKEWEHRGLPCLVLRNESTGNLCGYVGVPQGHPWHGKTYNDSIAVPREMLERAVDMDKISILSVFCLDRENLEKGEIRIDCALSVHGGITFSDAGNGKRWPSGYWWFGFDCAHSDDMNPGYSTYGTYRNIEYVTGETEHLADQLVAVTEWIRT